VYYTHPTPTPSHYAHTLTHLQITPHLLSHFAHAGEFVASVTDAVPKGFPTWLPSGSSFFNPYFTLIKCLFNLKSYPFRPGCLQVPNPYPKSFKSYPNLTDSISLSNPKPNPTERKGPFRLLSEQLPHLLHSLELENAPKWQRFAASFEAERDLPGMRGVSPFQKVLSSPTPFLFSASTISSFFIAMT
jgi:hypothetical protein